VPLIVLSIVGASTKQVSAVELTFTFLYMLNPMFTFYLTNYLIVIQFINSLIPDSDV
jgi:hypothetical protein